MRSGSAAALKPFLLERRERTVGGRCGGCHTASVGLEADLSVTRAGSEYRGRLAPSPTGTLHLGVARTSLVAWLRARQCGGSLVLRIEDIDGPRVVAGSAEAIMADLRWLGLDWDEGPDLGGKYCPYVQSERIEHYAAAIAQLRANDAIYPCTCSRKDILELASAPHGDLGALYPGTCRNGVTRRDRPAALRLRVDALAPEFLDRVHGAQPQQHVDDFVLQRGDGVYAYQLAVVVDDIAMRITEVVRGDDLLSSTPRQLALYRALGAGPPQFLHVPLMLGPDGRRLSKRDHAPSIAEYRAAGVSAERIIGLLASTLGLANERETLAASDLIERFDHAALPRTPTVLAAETLALR
jgi:glutamyl-tRNA synthetase